MSGSVSPEIVEKSEKWEEELLKEVQEVLGVGTEKVIVTGVS